MADISKITLLDGNQYNIKDTVARERISEIPSWALASTKPTYTASEVGALPSTTTIPTKVSDLTNDSGFITSAPVTSVNGQTGAVTLNIPSATTVTQTLTSGTKIGEVNGVALYAPSYTDADGVSY